MTASQVEYKKVTLGIDYVHHSHMWCNCKYPLYIYCNAGFSFFSHLKIWCRKNFWISSISAAYISYQNQIFIIAVVCRSCMNSPRKFRLHKLHIQIFIYNAYGLFNMVKYMLLKCPKAKHRKWSMFSDQSLYLN